MKHWYYPSTIVGCRLDHYALKADELTTDRSVVDCPGCLAQLERDRDRCLACRAGKTSLFVPHTCDPGG